jgi:hypothetical protein
VLAGDVAREILVSAPCVLGCDHDDRATVADRAACLLNGAHDAARVHTEDVVPHVRVELRNPGPTWDDPSDRDQDVDPVADSSARLAERRRNRGVVT